MIVISIDLETTGFSPKKDQIIEIGAIKYDVEAKREIGSFSTFVLPTSYDRWWEEGQITREMVKAYGVPPVDAIRSLLCWSGYETYDLLAKERNKPEMFIAHNAKFDERFFDVAIAKTDLECYLKWWCTMRDAKKKLPRLKHFKLQDVAKYYDISMGKHHRALDDARTALKIYLALEGIWRD